MTDSQERRSASPEHARLQEIADLGLVAGGSDEVLRDLVQDAAESLNLPISLVSVVLPEAQVFVASTGLEGWMADAGGTPAEWAFCAHAVHDRQPFIVENATEHPVVQANPLVTEDGVRCYAGIPLITSKGHALGTLCVIGDQPRRFTEDDLETLQSLADRALERLEARRE